MLRLRRLRVLRVGDRLRAMWDFSDLDATEARFRKLLADEPSAAGRGEVLTQLARVEGLRGRFDAGHALVAEAEQLDDGDDLVRARALLERGRLYRSSGDAASALPVFEAAFEVALAAGEQFLAVDAAHMAALAAPDQAALVSWTKRGIDLAESSADRDVAYWAGPLLNNLGWSYYEGGAYDEALAAFEQALAARERDPAKPEAREIARYAVGKTLRALGRAEEAARLLEQAVAWSETAEKPDGWFHEEVAEIYAALGRLDEAREHAKRALSLLEGDLDDARSARLRLLAVEAAP